MRRHSKSSRAQINELLRRIQAGTITSEDLLELVADTQVDYQTTQAEGLPAKRGETVLHSLNGVLLTRFVVGIGSATRFVYEATWRGAYAAGADQRDALARMRAKFPKVTPRVGEIIAIRGWHLRGDCLMPLMRDNNYATGPVVKSDLEPTLENSSGLYSVKATPENLRMLIVNYSPAAYGFVGLLGRVVEHEDGYRSSNQIIRRLILRFPASDAYVKCLADRYDCEVVIEKRFREAKP